MDKTTLVRTSARVCITVSLRGDVVRARHLAIAVAAGLQLASKRLAATPWGGTQAACSRP